MLSPTAFLSSDLLGSVFLLTGHVGVELIHTMTPWCVGT